MTHSNPAPTQCVPPASRGPTHGAGDKGNRLNVCVMPYNAEAFQALSQQLTPERVLQAYAHRGGHFGEAL